MSKVCSDWKIPCLNVSDIRPDELPLKLEEIKPKIILCSIEDLNNEDIQDKLQLLNIAYVSIDECQVSGMKRQEGLFMTEC